MGGRFAVHPAYSRLIWPAPFPKSFSQLTKTTFPYYLGFERELSWLVSLLSAHADLIARAIKIKDEVDRSILHDDLAGIKETLDRVELELGQSVWLAGHRINLLHQAPSFGSKSEYVRSITGVASIPATVKQAVAWFSYRSGSDVSPSDVRRLLETGAPLRYGVDYIIHLIVGQSPKLDDEMAGQILSHTDVLPAIDRYRLLLETLKALAVSGCSAETRSMVLRVLSPLAAKLADPALDRTLLYYGGSGEHLVPAGDLVRRIDLYSSGDYTALLTDISAEPLDTLSIETINLGLRAASLSGGNWKVTHQSGARKSLVIDISNDLASILAFEETAGEARTRLQKAVLLYSACSWASSLNLLVERQENDERIFGPTRTQAMSALSVTVEHPSLAFALPGDCGNPYLARLNDSLAQPSQTVAVLKSVIAGDETVAWPESFPRPRTSYLKAVASAKRGDLAGALEELAPEMDELGLLTQREAALVLVKGYIITENLIGAAEVVARLFVRSRYYGLILPLPDLVRNLLKHHDEPLKQSKTRGAISVAITFDIYSRYVSSDRDAERADAYKDVLRKTGVSLASELPDISDGIPREQLVYFLRNVCVPEVLDQSLALPTTRAVEDERAAILVRLSELNVDPDRSDAALKDELREIRTRQVVRETSLRLDQSKIYVNVDGIRRVVDVALRESWNRFRLMTAESLDDINFDELEKLVKSALGETARYITINTPFSDRSSLFSRIIVELRDQFAFNKEFGLNSNLSTNIRHGYVLRELRAPLLAKSLITNRNSDTDSYNPNPAWLTKVPDSQSEDRETLTEIMSAFSQRIDDIIEHLNRDLLRIRSDSTPDGLFLYDINTYILPTLEAKWGKLETYDEFIGAVFDSFWLSTERSLATVRLALNQEILSQINAALDDLDDAIRSSRLDVVVPGIGSAISMARPEVRSAVDRVASWFTLSGNNEYQDFDLEIPYQGGLQTIKTYYSDVEISGNYNPNRELVFRGWSLPVFNRLLFLLLDNAAEHSAGPERQLNVSVRAEVDSGMLLLRVENGIHPSVDRERLDEVVARINEQYGQAGQTDLFGQDKGTGFAKIWKLLNFDLQKEHFLRVYATDHLFGVEILMSSVGLVVE